MTYDYLSASWIIRICRPEIIIFQDFPLKLPVRFPVQWTVQGLQAGMLSLTLSNIHPPTSSNILTKVEVSQENQNSLWKLKIPQILRGSFINMYSVGLYGCTQYRLCVTSYCITLKLRFDEGTENLLLNYINELKVNQNSSCYTTDSSPHIN